MTKQEQLNTISEFMTRWSTATKELNRGKYSHFEFPTYRLHELVEDFSKEQTEYVQEQLDQAEAVIGKVNLTPSNADLVS